MRYNSITEYFYKFYSALLFITIIPIFAFIALYLQPSELPSDISQKPDTFIVIGSIIIFLWLVMTILFNKKIKTVRNRQGLGKKLDKYFQLTIVRYTFLCATGLILAIGFYIEHHDFFTAFFIFQLMMSVLLWPFARKICKDLRLKGDEYEMVYHRKDTF